MICALCGEDKIRLAMVALLDRSEPKGRHIVCRGCAYGFYNSELIHMIKEKRKPKERFGC